MEFLFARQFVIIIVIIVRSIVEFCSKHATMCEIKFRLENFFFSTRVLLGSVLILVLLEQIMEQWLDYLEWEIAWCYFWCFRFCWWVFRMFVGCLGSRENIIRLSSFLMLPEIFLFAWFLQEKWQFPSNYGPKLYVYQNYILISNIMLENVKLPIFRAIYLISSSQFRT